MTTLYQKLGGADGIARIVDDMVDRNIADPRITDIFTPIFDWLTMNVSFRNWQLHRSSWWS